ncbi:MAG: putative single-stranded DNA-binding protein [Prokaryotic dsDNA virus sp.]|nr:MAG: putative single-stranded DNA-binding protein [Prokaryotic dsDNA virus sp.]|tara:strand:+ start:16475 stop:16990 length:516 start_codon:yes stop_codon:yes gene_type:complete
MNNWNFTGNLGNPAEVKTLPSGSTVCEFSVAVKSGYGDKEKTNWVRCAMFGKKAEGQLPSYLQKGTQVAISGELELQEWEGQNGKGAALSVRVENLDLIGGKPQGQSQGAQNTQGYAPQQQQAPSQQYQQQQAPAQQYQQQAQQQNAPQQQGGYAPQGGFNPNDSQNNPPF